MKLLYLIAVYLFASIPNGYLVTKWFTGKDIRKIGKKKLSGSNVIRNVGFLPGILSGVFDMFKGALAVFGAQWLGFPVIIQVSAGVLAIAGQMWPIFLKFWGGRGGAAAIGAILILSPKITLLSIPIWPLAKLIGDRTKILAGRKGSPLGMSLFIILIAVFGFYFNKIPIAWFGIVTFVIIHLQRVLGVPGSLGQVEDKKIIWYRLLYDRDTELYQ